MKPTLLCGLALLLPCGSLLLPSSAGEPAYEDIVKGMLSTVEQITDILGTITALDKSSAEAATPQLKAAADKLLQLRDQANKVKQPSKTEKDRLAKVYAAKFEVAFKKLREQTLRVQSIEIPGIDDALRELAKLKEKKEPKDKKKGDDGK
jgi:hypothetical protein